MQQKQPSKHTKLIALIFAIFFSTFIIVDICYIIVAEKTWRGLSTQGGYQKGLQYNQTIAAVDKQKELGWDLQMKYQSKGSKSGNLQIKLLDKNKQEIRDAIIIANIKRPVQEGKDFTVQLNFDSTTSTYNSLINFPLIGQWDVEVIAHKNDNFYQNVRRLIIR